MAEQQLVDYIKKAKEAGQSDDQTKSLLLKNGWTDAEVSDAFGAINPAQPIQPAQPAQPEPQPQIQPQIQQQPQVQPQYQPQQSVMAESHQIKSKSHALANILIALVVLVIIGCAGYFFAGQYFNLPGSFKNSLAQSPEAVIAKMDANMKTVKTYHATVSGDFVAASKEELLASADGVNDLTDLNNPKSNFNFTANITNPGSTAPVATVSVSAIATGGNSYVMLNNGVFAAGFIPGLNISQIQGKWFEADQNSMTALPQVSILQPNNFSVANKLQNLMLAENIFSNIKQLNSQVINGQNTYHYSATINNANLNNFINREMPAGYVAATPGNATVELWIGKTNYMLYQYQINESGIKITATNSDFNNPVTIQAPADSQKIETILLPFIKLQQIESDLLQVNTVAQSVLVKNSSYSTLCKNGLLNAYLKMGLLTFSKDIVSQDAKTPVCFGGAQNYCVSSQLADGTWMCIGKTGIIGKTNCVSSATVCE